MTWPFWEASVETSALYSNMSRCFPALAVGYHFLTNAFFKAMGAITFSYTIINLLRNIFL